MEEMVRDTLDRLMTELGELASNEKVKLDVMALALNQLPPRYVVSTRGEVLSRLLVEAPQAQAEITAVLMQAIDHIRQNPANAPVPPQEGPP